MFGGNTALLPNLLCGGALKLQFFVARVYRDDLRQCSASLRDETKGLMIPEKTEKGEEKGRRRS